jgi:drug/metabolite transporter (DMT)-like permease
MTSLNPILFVFFGIITSAAAQIFLKIGFFGIITSAAAQIFLKIGSSFELFQFRWYLHLVFSLLSYAIAFFSYYLALKYFDISKISPIMMASIVSIVAIYGFFAGESFTYSKIFGIALSFVAIFLISKS